MQRRKVRLAGAGGADDRHDVALAGGERNAFKNFQIAEGLVKVPDTDRDRAVPSGLSAASATPSLPRSTVYRCSYRANNMTTRKLQLAVRHFRSFHGESQA